MKKKKKLPFKCKYVIFLFGDLFIFTCINLSENIKAKSCINYYLINNINKNLYLSIKVKLKIH